jgi:dTDP-4-amino-4,6-dideoxygalactose transaminase
MNFVPFNKPYLTGKEMRYMQESVASGKISGNGLFTQKCHDFFESNFGFKKVLLTTSCTDALEMCAMLLDISAGDEVIVPSYTFVSSALAFVRQGAKIVFVDSMDNNPNMDVDSLRALITPKTKAIVAVHYAGVACDMDAIMALASEFGIFVVEDAAQGIDSYYNGKPLGSIGHLGCFSFHETKNIISGEGGMLAINDERFIKRAEILWEKGTNRAEFFRGEINKYGWVDTGSSFLPSDMIAAFLFAQLENLQLIQDRRKKLWNLYWELLSNHGTTAGFQLPVIPDYATNNAHMFYLICDNVEVRSAIIQRLKSVNCHAVFHYLSLHSSAYYESKHDGRMLPNADRYSDCLLRLPMFFELTEENVNRMVNLIMYNND